MNGSNKLIEGKLAVLAIDMHRGHLDPEVATLPLPADKCRKLIDRSKIFFSELRKKKIPIIHIVSQIRGSWEIINNPYFRIKMSNLKSTRKNAVRHNIEGSVGTKIISELYREGDCIVNNKKRYSGFYSTDLDFLLKTLRITTVALTGVNTNSCVLCNAFEAHTRDFKVLVVKDCVDTMDGGEFHEYALAIVERALGFVVSSNELINSLKLNLRR